MQTKLGKMIGENFMNKEEILEKSRTENKNMDEYEKSVLSSAGKLAAQIGMLMCCVIAVLEVIFLDHISYASWMIYFSILSTIFIYKYLKIKDKHELLLAALYGAIFIMFTVLFINGLIG